MSDKIARTEPDFLYTMQVFGESLKYDLNCHRVGKIVKFYPESLTCDVELLELKPNQGRLDKYALFQGLPLMVNGGIGTNLTFGDVTGSECLVHFNDRDIDAWFDTGEAYKPNSSRLHSFSDGFVSLRPYNKNDVFQYEIDGTVLNRGTTKIKLANDGSVQITNGTCNFAMSGDTITVTGNLVVSGTVTAADCISGGISGKTHTHGGVTGGSSSTDAPQ